MEPIYTGDELISDIDGLKYKVVDISEPSGGPAERQLYLRLMGRFQFPWPFNSPAIITTLREKFVRAHFRKATT